MRVVGAKDWSEVELDPCKAHRRGLVLAVRGESPPSPRDERGARLAMSRKARISGIFGLLSEEAQTGCIVRRRQADFHHGLLDAMLKSAAAPHVRGVFRGPHAYFNRLDEARHARAARACGLIEEE